MMLSTQPGLMTLGEYSTMQDLGKNIFRMLSRYISANILHFNEKNMVDISFPESLSMDKISPI